MIFGKYSQFNLEQTYYINGLPFVIMKMESNFGTGNQTVFTGLYGDNSFIQYNSKQLNKMLNTDKLRNINISVEAVEAAPTSQPVETAPAAVPVPTSTNQTSKPSNNSNNMQQNTNDIQKALAVLAGAFGGSNNQENEILTKCENLINEKISALEVSHKIEINELPAQKIDGLLHKNFENVLKWVSAGFPVYLFGEAGTGKNVLAEQVAKALGLQFYYAGCLQQKYELEGFIDASGEYQETEFFKAFKNGGVFLFDEIDGTAAEVLIAFNAALANGYYNFPKFGRVHAHENFRILAAGNTAGRGATSSYNGRYQLDSSTLDRFVFVGLDYDDRILLSAANGDHNLVEFSKILRKVVKTQGLTYTISPRGLRRFALGQSIGVALPELMAQSFCGGWDDSDIKMMQRALYGETNKYVKIFNTL